MKKPQTLADLAKKKAKVLNANDITSATFSKLFSFYIERLEMLREQNDTLKDEGKTNVLRGRIAEAKYFLSLAKAGGQEEEDEPDDLDY